MASVDPRAASIFGEAVRLREGGRPLDALACYLEAEALQPDHYLPPQHLGGLLTELGRLAAGEAALRRCLRMRPEDAPTRHSLAVNLMAQGRVVGARQNTRVFRSTMDGSWRPVIATLRELAG